MGEEKMNSNQIVGIVLLVAGAILLYVGYQSSQGLADQVHETFTGRFTESTIWYFVFGAASALVGVGLLISRR
jgi:drug/metabolite transporter (DMT)-like permease